MEFVGIAGFMEYFFAVELIVTALEMAQIHYLRGSGRLSICTSYGDRGVCGVLGDVRFLVFVVLRFLFDLKNLQSTSKMVGVF